MEGTIAEDLDSKVMGGGSGNGDDLQDMFPTSNLFGQQKHRQSTTQQPSSQPPHFPSPSSRKIRSTQQQQQQRKSTHPPKGKGSREIRKGTSRQQAQQQRRVTRPISDRVNGQVTRFRQAREEMDAALHHEAQMIEHLSQKADQCAKFYKLITPDSSAPIQQQKMAEGFDEHDREMFQEYINIIVQNRDFLHGAHKQKLEQRKKLMHYMNYSIKEREHALQHFSNLLEDNPVLAYYFDERNKLTQSILSKWECTIRDTTCQRVVQAQKNADMDSKRLIQMIISKCHRAQMEREGEDESDVDNLSIGIGDEEEFEQ